MHHTKHQVKYIIPNLFPKVKKYGDCLEARISAIENIQEECRHDIREMEEQLARLTSLFEDMAIHPRSPSPLPNQHVPRPFIQTTSHLPRKTDRPNLRQPMPIAPPTFMATFRPVDQPSGSMGKPNGRKIDKDKPRWDPIPITYAELLPKLIDNSSIMPIQGRPRKPPFLKWYDINTRYN